MFSDGIFPTSAISQVTGGILSAIRDNIGVILGMLAFIVGISMVMAWLDMSAESKTLDRYATRWKR